MLQGSASIACRAGSGPPDRSHDAAHSRRWFLALALSGCAASLAACHRRARKLPGGSFARTPGVARIGAVETGVASWYGHPYHGRAAANGEIYDMEKLTAAHRTLPFNTWVRVENLANGKTVDVRIIDRGPFVENRVVDLSHAAARAIDLIGPGTARVRLEVIRAPEAASLAAAVFAVQVGAFRNKTNAERLRAEMEKRYGSARIVRRDADTPLWRVLVGSEPDEASAGALAARIRNGSREHAAAFVVRVDSV